MQLAVDIPMQGSEYQEIHRDFRPLSTNHIVNPLYAVAVNFPLVEDTTDNGSFEMARGTHGMPREEGLVKVREGEMVPVFTNMRTDTTVFIAADGGKPRVMALSMGLLIRSWVHTLMQAMN